MKKYFLFIVAYTFCLSVYAQGQGQLKGEIFDPILEEGLADVVVTLMTADSTVLTQATSKYATYDEQVQRDGYTSTITYKDRKRPAHFQFAECHSGTYILKYERKGYETLYQNVSPDYSSKSKVYDLGEIWLTREAVQLSEATVTGTMLKMVYKGDTMVYNAAAIQTADGDMLGNLIEKLPGAEINEGRITINGRFVESLLINGKDFFNGNVEQALRSLPAFTVSKIKTYEKAGDLSETTGVDMHDKTFVMDVALKRQYNRTWITSIDAMGGTHGRYNLLGSVLRTDENLSFCLVGEANNINNKIEAFEGRRQFTITKGDGIRYSRAAFATLRYEPDQKIKVGATASIRNTRDYTGVHESREAFLSGANLFSRAETGGKLTGTHVTADANASWRPMRGLLLKGKYKFEDKRQKDFSASRSASFLCNPDSLWNDVLQTVFELPSDNTLVQRFVQQRLAQETLGDNHLLRHTVGLEGQKAFGANLLRVEGDFKYFRQNNKAYNLYNLEFMRPAASDEATDYRHRFYDKGERNAQGNAKVSYAWKYALDDSRNGSFTPYYNIMYARVKSDNPLYRLDWWDGDTTVIDWLPSTRDDLRALLDGTNSYWADREDVLHEAGVVWNHEFQLPGKSWMMLSATLPYCYRLRSMTYERGGKEYDVSHTDRHVNPSLSLRFRPFPDDRSGRLMTIQLDASSTARSVSLYNLLDLEDAADPLDIRLGNPNLKDARRTTTQLSLQRNWPDRASSFNTAYTFSAVSDEVCISKMYDVNTGATTSMPVNIDGNWQMSWNGYYNVPVDKKQKWIMSLSADWKYVHSKDLNSWSDLPVSEESVVLTSQTSLKAHLNFRPGPRWDVAFSVSPAWHHVASSQRRFSTISAWQVNYAMDVYVKLPLNIDFRNRMAVNSRYGYADKSMCGSRWLWNASLERDIVKGLSASVEGFDLLHQNRRMETIVDAQGRTERFFRMLPPYFMLGLHWNFTKLPAAK